AETPIHSAALVAVGDPAGPGRPFDDAGAQARDVRAEAQLPVALVPAIDALGPEPEIERAHARGRARPDVLADGRGRDRRRDHQRRRYRLQPEIEDRKSTRLNSSHSQISYAVFCLKKKKQRLKAFTFRR